MGKLDDGAVEIVLDGAPAQLLPTIMAAKALSRQFGGFGKAIAAIGAMEFDAYLAVAKAGLGLAEDDVDKLTGRIYRTGLLDLIGPFTAYLLRLANGGRPPKEKGAGAEPKTGEA